MTRASLLSSRRSSGAASSTSRRNERSRRTCRQYTYVNGQHVINEPDLKLNLYIMFAANFKVYEEALKYLSYILLFFQTHPFFDQQVFPDLDPRIDKLTAELQSPTLRALEPDLGL